MNLCQNSTQIQCSVFDILNRIEPIQYEDDILVINSPVSTSASVIYINEEPIVVNNGVLNFPLNSTVDNEPLKDSPFTGDILELPPQTTINDYKIFTTNYFYFLNNSINKNKSGYYVLLGGGANENPTYNLKGIEFPFIASQDCVLTSLVFSFVGNKGTGLNATTITNINAYIMKIDTAGTITNTGISVTIATCLPNTKPYVDKQFQYPLSKGEAIGIMYTFVGSINSTYGGSQFATLGYKFLT